MVGMVLFVVVVVGLVGGGGGGFYGFNLFPVVGWVFLDRKSTRLNSSHVVTSRMTSSA